LSQPGNRVGWFAGIGKTARNTEVPMQKKYNVRLTDQERKELVEVVKKLKSRARRCGVLRFC
jgi:hypothetical protein